MRMHSAPPPAGARARARARPCRTPASPPGQGYIKLSVAENRLVNEALLRRMEGQNGAPASVMNYGE